MTPNGARCAPQVDPLKKTMGPGAGAASEHRLPCQNGTMLIKEPYAPRGSDQDR